MALSDNITIKREYRCTADFADKHVAWFNEEDYRIIGERIDDTAYRIISAHLHSDAPMTAIATALETGHISGNTEPWIQDIVLALLAGLQRDNPTVLECGGFMGSTSAKLAATLQRLGGGTLIVAEWDPEAPERADLTQAAIEAVGCKHVNWTVRREDACSVIRSLADESVSFAFLDDDHSHAHVDEELRLLIPKMETNGIISGHDCYGSCDLQVEFRKYGGYALDLPRLGAAGGIGILQCR